MILLIDSIRIAAPSGSGIPLDADMSRALQAMPFDKHEDKSPPDIPAIKVVFEEEESFFLQYRLYINYHYYLL